MSLLRCCLVLLGLVSLSAFAGCGAGASAANQPSDSSTSGRSTIERVRAAAPVRKSLVRSTVQPARIEAFEETPLHAKVNGYVEAVMVDIGDRVTRGQTLIKLSAPEMLDNLRQSEAALVQARAEVEQAAAAVLVSNAKLETASAAVAQAEAGIARSAADYRRWTSEYARMERLANEDTVTQKVAEESLQQLKSCEAAQQEAQAKAMAAKAGRAEAEANIEKAKADQAAAEAKQHVAEAQLAREKSLLEYLELKAPFDGVITARNVDTGHFLQASGVGAKPLLAVARTDRLRVFIDVPEPEAPLVTCGEHGDPAVVKVQALGGRECTGQVTRCSWALASTNWSLRTEIELANDAELLRPGMYATVQIVLDEREQATVLPMAAIVPGESPSCFRVVAGKLEQRPVTLGLRAGDEVEVASGLEASDVVVTAGVGTLHAGQAVEVVPQS